MKVSTYSLDSLSNSFMESGTAAVLDIVQLGPLDLNKSYDVPAKSYKIWYSFSPSHLASGAFVVPNSDLVNQRSQSSARKTEVPSDFSPTDGALNELGAVLQSFR